MRSCLAYIAGLNGEEVGEVKKHSLLLFIPVFRKAG